MSKPDYDTSLARMAGNIAVGFVSRVFPSDYVVRESVAVARAIVAEIKRTSELGVDDRSSQTPHTP